MIFQRVIWAALCSAVLVGSVQTGMQRWQAAPLILAAEVFEDQKSEAPEPAHPGAAVLQVPDEIAHAHEHGSNHEEWQPANGAERIGWTWVANVLHALSMALLMFAAMGVWLYRQGAERKVAVMPLAAWVAVAGWLSFHLWPSLGLSAEVPGMEAAPLHERQLWWALAVASAAGACAVAGFVRAPWRWLLCAALLALPFVVGAPRYAGDPLAGFTPEAHAALEQLAVQFVWATTWMSLAFWGSLGLVGGWAFQRWVAPALLMVMQGTPTPDDAAKPSAG